MWHFLSKNPLCRKQYYLYAISTFSSHFTEMTTWWMNPLHFIYFYIHKIESIPHTSFFNFSIRQIKTNHELNKFTKMPCTSDLSIEKMFAQIPAIIFKHFTHIFRGISDMFTCGTPLGYTTANRGILTN